MTYPLIMPLVEVRMADAVKVGHKAAVLGTLLEAGFPVLPGICLTITAFHLALQAKEAAIQAVLDATNLVEALLSEPTVNVMEALELHNHYIDQMALGQLRQVVVAAADWLCSQNLLPAADDIYWQQFDEILAVLRQENRSDLAAIVGKRKDDYAAWSELEPPPLLGTPIVELQPGDILVAENIGPLWTPWFPMLGGLVLDTRALGQHAAATAREYGPPAVTGTMIATLVIPDEAQLVVNGGQGTVDILSL